MDYPFSRMLEENEVEVSPTMISCIVFCILTVLVAVTMLFEVMEEKLLHKCDKTLKPIVSSLFGEMTILGFLNLVIYCISSLGILKNLSARVIDDSHEGQMYIQELLEKIHYLLFFIMVLFIAKVLILLQIASTSVEEWKERNRQVQNEADVEKWTQRYIMKPPPSCLHFFETPEDRKADPDRFFAFLSIRREFLLHRTPISPFSPLKSGELPVHFDYAHYLSICLGKTVAHVIHMPPITWAAVWLFCGVFFAFYAIFDGNITVMAFAWLGWGFVNFYGISVLSRKLNSIYAKLLNPADFPDWSRHDHGKEHLPYAIGHAKELLTELNATKTEERPLNSRKTLQTMCTLPYWTKQKPCYGLNLRTGEHYMSHRHHALFWFGKFGPEFLIFMVRLHLLLRSMYIALVVAVFVPQLVDCLGAVAGAVYFALAMLPVYLEYLSYLQELITTLCQVTNTGLLPNHHAVDEVLRRHKTRGAVRAIIMMTSLVQSICPSSQQPSPDSLSTKKRRQTMTVKLPQGQTEDEINEIGDVFDMYDADMSGEIQRDELEVVMKSLGYSLTHDQFSAMFRVLDLDGDGSITREEFINWHVRNHDTLLMSKREMAVTMFKIFDTRNSGVIQISDLVQRLQGLNHGLSTEDLMQLVNDLDTNRDGVICLDEFQNILKDH